MVARSRFLLCVLLGALLLVVSPVAEAKPAAVPKVAGLAPAGSSLSTAKLGVKWSKVSGASYQVRWASSTAALAKAKVYATTKTSALSPTLSSVCPTWYAQVRAKKGSTYGAWSSARALKFSGTGSVVPPVPVTTGQSSTTQVQLRWAKTPGMTGYRFHYAPAPFFNWPGYDPTTPLTSAAATGLSVNLPAVGEGDRFLGAAYGNPVFGQLEGRRCNGTYPKSKFLAVFPRALPAGDASSGSALRFGSYNVELAPQSGNPKIAVLATTIASAGLDVLALQEANAGTAAALQAALAGKGQGDWDFYGLSQQFVMWRTSRWTSPDQHDIGQPVDGTAGTPSNAAKTPLPSPGVHLTPAVADPNRQDIFVASVHLEDRRKFQSSASNAQQKQDAQDAVLSLLSGISSANPGGLPTLVAGDLKGNFGGGGQPATTGNCDESSTPACPGEGQPTFIRHGYLDARGAESRQGVQYGTVNGHQYPQVAASSGIGSRADFIVVKGFTGTKKYVNVANLSGTNSPSDHNLIYADYFVPFTS